MARSRNLERHDLPLPSTRTKAEGKVVARAAQAFNVQPKSTEEHDYVGFIMGHLQLPPKAIKDAESSGKCAHTFTVCHCQPNALEVAYADPSEGEGKYEAETAQRLLLNPGDMFRIPQGNSYRIQNHSTTMDCLLTWTIIKPHSNDSWFVGCFEWEAAGSAAGYSSFERKSRRKVVDKHDSLSIVFWGHHSIERAIRMAQIVLVLSILSSS